MGLVYIETLYKKNIFLNTDKISVFLKNQLC